uniref:NADH-ubiquinone oxidoreductase chain 2 n=1 Tax=Metatropis longirostris TaxID=2021940 RepID=A0A343ISD9_9HEMI|nr:NADH dehydrogenase subunit 2 [Metatropis longirostris]AST10164.1 NADH dehydrogenase subunit 2 [Metatropis longirostris]
MSFNFLKMMFLMMILMSTMLTISSSNWIGMWMGMEMNLMSFIPFISKIKNTKSSKATMIYFLVQSIGSVILLFSILVNSFIMISPIMMEEITNMSLMLGLLIKLGVAPFHMWMPEMMSNLSWMDLMVFMTWQKLAPMYTLSNLINNNWMIMTSILMSTIIGAIGGINLTSLRKIMAFSSINHLGWMLIMMVNNNMWYMYLMLYSIMIIMACTFFNNYNSYFINQLNNSSMSMMEKYIMASIMLSIGGLPPFLGFLPKWMAIESMINSNMLIVMLIMIMMSLLTLFYYMRMISSLMMMFNYTNKWLYLNKIKMNYILLVNFSLPLFSVISFF